MWRPPRSTLDRSSAASDVYKRQTQINALPQAALWAQMQLAQSEQQSLFLFKHRLASGEVRDVEVHASPLEVGGRPLLFSIVHDAVSYTHLRAHETVLDLVCRLLLEKNKTKKKKTTKHTSNVGYNAAVHTRPTLDIRMLLASLINQHTIYAPARTTELLRQ